MQRKVQIQIILYQPITFEKVGGEWQFEIDQTKKNIEYRLNFLNEENTYLSSQVSSRITEKGNGRRGNIQYHPK